MYKACRRYVREFLRPPNWITLRIAYQETISNQYLYLYRSDKSITCITVTIIYNVSLSLSFAFIAQALRCKSRLLYILLFPWYQQWSQRCFTTLISIVAQSTPIFYIMSFYKYMFLHFARYKHQLFAFEFPSWNFCFIPFKLSNVGVKLLNYFS